MDAEGEWISSRSRRSAPRRRARLVGWLLISIVTAANAAKLVHLAADFPSGFTWSGVLYTDEGWYTYGAITHHLQGHWRVDGGMNLITMMPVGQVVQATMFRLFGLSAVIARLTVALFSIALVALVVALARRYVDPLVSWAIAAILSTNFLLFAYSRLATSDVMMLTLATAAILTAVARRPRSDVAAVLAAGLILAAAVLTKTNAAFGLPVLAYAISTRTQDWGGRIALMSLSALACVSAVALFDAFSYFFYRTDFLYLQQAAIVSRAVAGPRMLVANVRACIQGARAIGPALYWGVPVAVLLCALSSRMRQNTLARLAVVWIGAAFLMLGGIVYHPQRYFLVLIVPAAVLCGMGLTALGDLLPTRIATLAQGVALTVIVGVEAARIGAYLLHPEYSFAEMTRGVMEAIETDGLHGSPPLIVGPFGPSISLWTGLRGIDSSDSTETLAWRARTYGPSYLVAFGRYPPEAALLADYTFDPLGSWDVFHNYYNQQPVYLFALRSRISDSDQAPPSLQRHQR